MYKYNSIEVTQLLQPNTYLNFQVYRQSFTAHYTIYDVDNE